MKYNFYSQELMVGLLICTLIYDLRNQVLLQTLGSASSVALEIFPGVQSEKKAGFIPQIRKKLRWPPWKKSSSKNPDIFQGGNLKKSQVPPSKSLFRVRMKRLSDSSKQYVFSENVETIINMYHWNIKLILNI